ncbi:hemocyanin F chain-like isoform X6 [Penaeus japonicus]|uniref:hemocyanin F chain-like isoform X3 n=1 Tax=Penaeus japonicus TaxID=27405 RepID=UPI001C711B1A|nr:hemocyanin F chain-like isoform X3 [Penaeus japonicus]XP_042881569.1 hemocyanin F chain-like isoform X4 [Penaeus japonicus]XP_042881571.1 hemocyanin F chain-like isoform X6 [Penaeus japonicus]
MCSVCNVAALCCGIDSSKAMYKLFCFLVLLLQINFLWVSCVVFDDVEDNITLRNATNTDSNEKDEQGIRALLQMLLNPYTPTKVLSSRLQWARPTSFHFDPETKLLWNAKGEKAAHLGGATAVGAKDQFVWYNKDHRKAVIDLIDNFENATNPWEVYSMAYAIRNHINPRVFITVLLFLLETREDFEHVKAPSIAQVLPHLFFPDEGVLKSEGKDDQEQWKERSLKRTRRQVFQQFPNFEPLFSPGPFSQPFGAGTAIMPQQQVSPFSPIRQNFQNTQVSPFSPIRQNFQNTQFRPFSPLRPIFQNTQISPQGLPFGQQFLRPRHPPVFVQWQHNIRRTDIPSEQNLAYWREDILFNGHHWHWHLVHQLGRPSVTRHRKGEQFYYMHRNILVRYNWERLSLGMDFVEAYGDLRTPIREGYNPRFTGGTGEPWGARPPNTRPQDVDRELTITIRRTEVWRRRLLHAIRTGVIISRNRNEIAIRDVDIPPGGRRGIDILGDALESDWLTSENYKYYGDYHNFGHYIISAAHDPKGTLNEPLGVMAEPVTSVRDPVFYRWHKHVDDLFDMYKVSQNPYESSELSFPGVQLVNAMLLDYTSEPNNLHTFFNTTTYNSRFGLDFRIQESDPNYRPVVIRILHLDHRPFNYQLQINSQLRTWKKVVVRIFLAPKMSGHGERMTYSEQRRHWGEMDVFDVDIVPGLNLVTRASQESSILGHEGFPTRGRPGNERFDYQGCGWPPHLLLPRGSPSGLNFQVFIMLTDADRDIISSSRRPRSSFCVPPRERFQDRRPMGFPLDREMESGSALSTQEVFRNYANVRIVDVTVTHLE